MEIIIMVAEEPLVEVFLKAEVEEIGMEDGIIMLSLEIIKAEEDMVLTMPIILVLIMEILVETLVASLMEKVLQIQMELL